MSLLDLLTNSMAAVFILLLILSIRIGNRGIMEKVAVSEYGETEQFEPVLADLRKPVKNPPTVSIYLTVWGGEVEFKKQAPGAVTDSILVMRGLYTGTRNNWLILRNGPIGEDWSVSALIKSQPDSITIHLFKGSSPAGDWNCRPEDGGGEISILNCFEAEDQFMLTMLLPCQK